MYQNYFGFSHPPFSIAPDPSYLYLSRQHQEAFAHLLYGIERDSGFILLTGEVGTGKTTLLRGLLEQLPQGCQVAMLLHPHISPLELLASLCQELGLKLPTATGTKPYIDQINDHLLANHAQGMRTIVVLDEAQNLSPQVLEQLRLLTNLETNSRKLLQVVLVGQPELQELLRQPQLRQLSQRITARYHLTPLSAHEVKAYVQHRMAVAGVDQPLFKESALQHLAQQSQGIPRCINILCDHALTGAYARNMQQVTRRLLTEAAQETLPEKKSTPWPLFLTITLLLSAATALFLLWPHLLPQTQAPHQAKPPLAHREQSPVPNSSERRQESVSPWQIATNERSVAEKALAQCWYGKEPLPEAGTLKIWAKQQALELWQGRDSLRNLLHLNLPLILHLQHKTASSWLTVTGLSAEGELLIQREEQEPYVISPHQIADFWQGEFTLLWPAPAGYTAPLSPGDSAPWTEELRRCLWQWGYHQLGQEGETMDAALQQALQSFQQQQGLLPDGICGPKSLILLQQRCRPELPLLSRRPLCL